MCPTVTRHTSIRYSSSCHTHTRQHGCIDILHCCNDPCLYVSEVTWQWWDEYFARNARCIVPTDLIVSYSNTHNDFSPRAAIFSLHTLASPSGRNVNYYEKQLTGKKFLSCSFYLYTFRKYVSYGFPISNFCNPGVHYETHCIFSPSKFAASKKWHGYIYIVSRKSRSNNAIRTYSTPHPNCKVV